MTKNSPIPENVLDKELYASIKKDIHRELQKKGTRWGIYSSSELVRRYKQQGGRYDPKHEKTKQQGISRWYQEIWIDICKSDPPNKLVPCGRQDITKRAYPVCRPYNRVNDKTPTTYKELNKQEIESICRKKRRDPRTILPHFQKK